MGLNLGLDKEKTAELLRVIIEQDLHRFNQIAEELEWSKSTVSKYLKQLKEDEYLEKDITKGEQVGYFATEKGHNLDIFLSYYKDGGIKGHFKQRKDILRQFEEKGLFEEGINEEDALQILKNNKEKLDAIGKRTIEKYSTFNLKMFRVFYQFMQDNFFSHKIEEEDVDFNFQIESDKETFDKSLEDEKDWLYDEIDLDIQEE